jgi:hypothetical protein
MTPGEEAVARMLRADAGARRRGPDLWALALRVLNGRDWVCQHPGHYGRGGPAEKCDQCLAMVVGALLQGLDEQRGLDTSA